MNLRMMKAPVFVAIVVVLLLALVGTALILPTPVSSDPAPPAPTPTPVPPMPPFPPGINTLGIIGPDTPEGKKSVDMIGTAAKNAGINVVATQFYPPGITDFTPFLKKLWMDAKPDAIHTDGSGPNETSIITKQLKELGYGGQIISGSSIPPPETIHVGQYWTEQGKVLDPEGTVSNPTVVKSPTGYAMWYFTSGSIRLATSPEGVNWSDKGFIQHDVFDHVSLPPGGYHGLGVPSVLYQPFETGIGGRFLMHVSAFADYRPLLVVPQVSSINSPADLADKKVDVGAPGGWSEATVGTALGAYGLSYDQMQIISLAESEVCQALTTGVIDAAVIALHPNQCLSQLGVRLLPWSQEAVTAVVNAYQPNCQPFTLPANTYAGQTDPVPGWRAVSHDYIFVLESIDGLSWHYLGTAFQDDTPGAPPGSWLRPLTVIRSGSYEGWLNRDGGIYYTTSGDGVAWTEPQPTTGFTDMWLGMSVLRFPGKYVAWYDYPWEGSPFGAIGVAFSDNGVDWTPSPENPLLRIEPGTWRSQWTNFPWVICDRKEGLWKMWFVGMSGGDCAIGYATSPIRILQDVLQNKAGWGDEVIVHPGIYLGQVYVDKALRLRSSHGAAVTIIDALGEHKLQVTMPDGSIRYPALWMNVPSGNWNQVPDWWWEKYGRPEVKVEGLSLTDSDGAGIRIDLVPTSSKWQPWSRIADNRVWGNRVGIAAVSPALAMDIANNYVHHNEEQGIVVIANGWVNTTENNISENGAGILCRPLDSSKGSSLNISGGTIAHNGGKGIQSSFGNTGIGGSTISYNGGDGIYFQNGWANNNTIADNGGIGIVVEKVEKGGAWLQGNTITNNATGVQSKGWAEVRDNTISNNSANGVALDPGTGRVAGNTISGNGGNGIWCNSGNPSYIHNNTISDNAQSGVHLGMNTANSAISNNQITGNVHGILVEGDNNRIMVNTITGNTGAGSGIHLTVDAQDNQIHYNNITGNSTASSWGVFNESALPVDATNNWWGNANGPAGSGPGSGDSVNPNVLYQPWLTQPFSDTTPPVIRTAVALPEAIAIFGMGSQGGEPVTVGRANTDFLVEASDEHCGVGSVTLNLKELWLQLMPPDLDIPESAQGWWDNELSSRESWTIWQRCGGVWQEHFDLLGNFYQPLRDMLYKAGLNGDAETLLFKLRAGEVAIPVTVADWAGNQTSGEIKLLVSDALLPLDKGWSLRSTPIWLEQETWGEIAALGNDLQYDAALRFNTQTQQWEQVLNDDGFLPLEAIYIHATANDQLPLIVSRSPMPPPLRDLDIGWNLVGASTPLETGAMPVTDALKSIEQNVNGERGYLIALSPMQYTDYREEFCYTNQNGQRCCYGSYQWKFQQQPWLYLAGDELDGQTMESGDGYWVFMEHPDTLAGYMSTPIISEVGQGELSAEEQLLASTKSAPKLPALFYGTAKDITGGAATDVPAGSMLVARVNGVEKGRMALAEAGRYGGGSGGEPKLMLQGNVPKGSVIEFYIDGKRARQTAIFESGNVQEVNLTLGRLMGDVDGNDVINILDLVEVVGAFGATSGDAGSGYNPDLDFNADGKIDILDLSRIGIGFGRSYQ